MEGGGMKQLGDEKKYETETEYVYTCFDAKMGEGVCRRVERKGRGVEGGEGNAY